MVDSHMENDKWWFGKQTPRSPKTSETARAYSYQQTSHALYHMETVCAYVRVSECVYTYVYAGLCKILFWRRFTGNIAFCRLIINSMNLDMYIGYAILYLYTVYKRFSGNNGFALLVALDSMSLKSIRTLKKMRSWILT